MVVGEDIAVLREDHAGPHGHAVLHLCHHRYHRRIEPPVDLLGAQCLAVALFHRQRRSLPGIGGNRDLLRRRLLRIFIVIVKGVPAVPVGQEVLQPPGSARSCCQQQAEHHENQHSLFPPTAAPAGNLPGRRHPLRQGPPVRLHHLLGGGAAVGLYNLAGDLLPARQFFHAIPHASMLSEKANVVTPFSLVTLIFSLCCSKIVLTI